MIRSLAAFAIAQEQREAFWVPRAIFDTRAADLRKSNVIVIRLPDLLAAKHEGHGRESNRAFLLLDMLDFLPDLSVFVDFVKSGTERKLEKQAERKQQSRTANAMSHSSWVSGSQQSWARFRKRLKEKERKKHTAAE